MDTHSISIVVAAHDSTITSNGTIIHRVAGMSRVGATVVTGGDGCAAEWGAGLADVELVL